MTLYAYFNKEVSSVWDLFTFHEPDRVGEAKGLYEEGGGRAGGEAGELRELREELKELIILE